jgi:hypothetical protein
MYMPLRHVSLLLTLSLATALAAAQEGPQRRLPFDQDLAVKKQLGSDRHITIAYHNGPVMVTPAHLYVVYYGNFTTTQHSILDTFLQNVGGSPAFNVNTEYYNYQGKYVQNILTYSPITDSYDDHYSIGHDLSKDAVFDEMILHSAVLNGHLSADVNGIYLLTVSPDVALSNNVWCAYHFWSPAIAPGMVVKYAVAGDPPPSVLRACSGNIVTYHDKTSPNGDIGMDSVVDSFLHELSETVTDPHGNAWYTPFHLENGDLCSFVYGPTFFAPNRSHANHVFGDRNYLAQEIWSRDDPAACARSH